MTFSIVGRCARTRRLGIAIATSSPAVMSRCVRDRGRTRRGRAGRRPASAGLLVYGDMDYSRCDLRVDVSEEPVAELRRIFDWYKPLIPYYEARSRNPNVPRVKDHLKHLGIVRRFGQPVPVTRGPRAGDGTNVARDAQVSSPEPDSARPVKGTP
jgi:uncharacterized Ntn-hydrolase superfamily protein